MQDLDELKQFFFLICAEFEVKKTSVSSFYKENNFKPCLTKQFSNMLKLWCERGIRWSQPMCFGLKAGRDVVVTDIKQYLINSEL